MKKILYLGKRSCEVLKKEGFFGFLQEVKNYIHFLKNQNTPHSQSSMPALKISDHYHYDFIMDFDRKSKFKPQSIKSKKNLTINWIIPNFGIGSGGHLNIFRIIKGLEGLGHKSRIYIMNINQEIICPEKARAVIKEHFANLEAAVFVGTDSMKNSDVCIATSWQTAYPLYKVKNTKKKIYFIQDYESQFYAKSAESIFAEETYRMGYKAITAGKWLEKVMQEEYKMKADHFELSYSPEIYKVDTKIKKQNKKVLFYARHVTPRRGFELGILALQELKRMVPDVHITFIGWDCSDLLIPFEYENAGILNFDQLAALYNEATVGLVLSLTNYSLLPQEMIACGLPVVDIKGVNTELVYRKGQVLLAEQNPYDIAKKLASMIKSKAKRDTQVESGMKTNKSLVWKTQVAKIEKMIYSL